MTSPSRLALAACAALVLTGAAEARYACAVKRTPDGFVALRAGPSAKHPLVARMKPQELVGLLQPDTEDIKREGDWLYVRWYPGTKRTAFHIPDMDEKIAKAGWVYDRLLNCFEE